MTASPLRSVQLAALTLAGLSGLIPSSASASPFMQQLVGDWRGKGHIEQIGVASSKESLVCRVNFIYSAPNHSLKISGRCGSASGTTRFNSTLKEDRSGRIHGQPILQRGEVATIPLSGKPSRSALTLTGKRDGHSVLVAFNIVSEKQFRSRTENSAPEGAHYRTQINWIRQ